MQGRIDAMAPAREPVEQPDADRAAEPEIALVAAEAAEPRHGQQQDRVDQPLGRGEPGEQDHRLAFEKGPDKGDCVKAGAVMGNELVDIHRRRFFIPSPWRLPAGRAAALAAGKADMLKCRAMAVERIPAHLPKEVCRNTVEDKAQTLATACWRKSGSARDRRADP